ARHVDAKLHRIGPRVEFRDLNCGNVLEQRLTEFSVVAIELYRRTQFNGEIWRGRALAHQRVDAKEIILRLPFHGPTAHRLRSLEHPKIFLRCLVRASLGTLCARSSTWHATGGCNTCDDRDETSPHGDRNSVTPALHGRRALAKPMPNRA